MEGVLARRIGIGLAVLVLAVVVLVSVIDRVRDGDRARAPQPTRVATPAKDVTGELPADGTVRAAVGDIVSLAITTPQNDTVAIEELGEDLDTAAKVPELLRFVAFREGTFRIVAEMSGATLGRLVVEPAPRT